MLALSPLAQYNAFAGHRIGGIGQGVTLDSRRLMIVILVVLFAVGLTLSLVAAWRSGDWWGFALNLGTELVGAVVTYLLFDQFIEQRERTETEKARLIGEMGSGVNGVAVAAAEKLWQRGWLGDGSLQGANLGAANLREAELWNANLREIDFAYADLQGAKLIQVDLQGTNLGRANLQGVNLIEADLRRADLSWANLEVADLGRVKFDRNTTLPDGTRRMPKIYFRRFTNRDDPDFWRSDNPASPAYRGSDDD
jgi:hypothetical protein